MKKREAVPGYVHMLLSFNRLYQSVTVGHDNYWYKEKRIDVALNDDPCILICVENSNNHHHNMVMMISTEHVGWIDASRVM